MHNSTVGPRVVLGASLACMLALSAAGASAQAVPGQPAGDWQAYEVNTLTSEFIQRCAILPPVMAQWRKTLDEVAAFIARSPALADLTGYVPRMAAGVDVTAPVASLDCTKHALSGYVAFWPWLQQHVDLDPAARPGGPKYRLKKVWVNNGIGVLWISVNKIPAIEGSPWEKDERGVFFEQPEPEFEVAGFPMYKERIYINSPANPPLFAPVSRERVLRAYLVHARKEAPLSDSFLASRKKQYENFMNPASQERRKREIEAAAASQKNPASSEQARRHAEAIDRRREEDYRKAANPSPDDPIFEPVKRLKQAEALLAGLTDTERRAQAWRTSPQGGSMMLNLAPAGSPGARPVVEVNPAYFDMSAPRAALRNVVIWMNVAQMTRKLGTRDLDLMEKLDRAVVQQTDWKRLAQMMK